MLNFPKSIGSYKFERKLIPTDGNGGKYQFGIYRYGSLKSICKLTCETKKSKEVGFLKNEINAYITLASYRGDGSSVNPPRLLASKISEHFSYILIDYVDGISLREQSVQSMINGYERVINYLERCSEVSKKLPLSITTKSSLQLLIAFHYLLVISIFKCPQILKKIPIIVYVYYQGVIDLFRARYGLVHRDLGGNNVLISNGKLYLIDLQYFSWAPQVMENANLFVSRAWTEGFTQAFLNSNLYPKSISSRRAFKSLVINAILIDFAFGVGNPNSISMKLLDIVLTL